MNWLKITLVALAAFVATGTAEARRTVTTTVDPITGAETTTITRSSGFRDDDESWRERRFRRFSGQDLSGRRFGGQGWGRAAALGAPVVARRGFPVSPISGQRIWRAGRQWQFDADLGQWIIIR